MSRHVLKWRKINYMNLIEVTHEKWNKSMRVGIFNDSQLRPVSAERSIFN